MHTAEQVFQMIEGLPLAERRQLLERLAGELPKLVPSEAKKPAAEEDEPELIGFLADDPDLADEIRRIGTTERRDQEGIAA